MKVFSYTQPRENILNYSPWYIRKGGESKTVELVDGHRQGKLVVALLDGIADRDQAMALAGWKIFIRREQLPVLSQNEYYWTDLIGLEVKNMQGQNLGEVSSLMETGANDVLVVNDEATERLIPFLQQQTVIKVDLTEGLIVVDWDPDF